jgi:hypothetical protein
MIAWRILAVLLHGIEPGAREDILGVRKIKIKTNIKQAQSFH